MTGRQLNSKLDTANPNAAPPISTDDYRRIQVRPFSGALGADILGVDLSTPLDGDTFEEVLQALDNYLAVRFRDQRLTTRQYLHFARQFGRTVKYPFSSGLSEFPDVFEILKDPEHTSNFGGGWHSDSPFLAEPPLVTMLYALESPPVGGDTLLANMYLAYEALSPGMRRILHGLRAIHSASLVSSGGRANRYHDYTHMALSGMKSAGELEAIHPVVRRHGRTGRPALYLSEAHMLRFEGFQASASQPLLEFLYRHATQSQFISRIQWEPGSVAVFDNSCTQHFASNDYDGYRRRMHRITVNPTRPKEYQA